ncbi:hypothetical protein SLEP1_g49877 [Rubroshorea leprosula]|uniref:Pentatricopeptide repeat-containing protein n=1 Tax=Rubroshorea leprosula TaxID=152421 RepID=A0AAV5LYH5_9ROSI|nr:hypothetical protein SLEP1_g49877 [Rubroshorea leprosula]
MIRNHRILKLISTFRPQRSASNNARRYISSNPLWIIPESSPYQMVNVILIWIKFVKSSGKSTHRYEHPPEVFNTMVDMLGKAKKFDLMWDLVKEMQQFKGYVTLATMRKVMRRLVKATRYSDAIAAFREREKFGVSRDGEAIAVLMAALVKGNALDSVDHAYQVFIEFKELIPLTSICFDILMLLLISILSKADKLNDARKIFEDMERQNIKPKLWAYNAMISSACAHSREEESLKWLQKME